MVDTGAWTSPLNGSEIVTAATVRLQNDDSVNLSYGDRRDEKGVVRLMAAEVIRPMKGE